MILLEVLSQAKTPVVAHGSCVSKSDTSPNCLNSELPSMSPLNCIALVCTSRVHYLWVGTGQFHGQIWTQGGQQSQYKASTVSFHMPVTVQSLVKKYIKVDSSYIDSQSNDHACYLLHHHDGGSVGEHCRWKP